MLTPSQWTAALSPLVTSKNAAAYVAKEVRSLVQHDVRFAHPAHCSTNDLVEILFPAMLARGEGITARNRLFKLLFALATGDLSDCCTRGAEVHKRAKAGFMNNKRPWLWHEPTVPNGEATAYHHRLSLRGCPLVKPQQQWQCTPHGTVYDDNDWIDENFDAVLWFLKQMTKDIQHE